MGFDSSGTLTVTLDGNVIKNGFFAEGVLLLDKCFRDLQTMTLSNPSRDDWTGSIIIKAAGKSTMISCKGCRGDSYFERITVDGTDDDTGHADTQCPIGNNCSISWIQTGIKYIGKRVKKYIQKIIKMAKQRTEIFIPKCYSFYRRQIHFCDGKNMQRFLRKE